MYCNLLIAYLLYVATARSLIPDNAISLLTSAPRTVAYTIDRATDAIQYIVIFVLVVVLLRLIVRRMWIADVIVSIFFGLSGSFAFENIVGFFANAIFMYITLWLLRRYGFLAILAGWYAYVRVPFSLTSWYAEATFLVYGIQIALAAWALWVILSDKSRAMPQAAS